MNEIGIKSNIDELIKELGDFDKKQLPFIQKETVNSISFDVQSKISKQVQLGLNWKKKVNIKGIVRVKKATKSNPNGEVYLDEGGTGKTNWGYYALMQHFTGTDRHRKGLEKAMIAKGYMTSNDILTPPPGVIIKPSVYVQIMSQLKLNFKEGFSANETKASKKKNKNSSTVRYFVATSKINHHLAMGIYARMSGVKSPICILRISEKPKYEKRFDFKQTAEKVINTRSGYHFNKAFEYAMRTAK